jgi:hypothetical protein
MIPGVCVNGRRLRDRERQDLASFIRWVVRAETHED